MSYLTPTTALGAGLACFGLGVTRRVDTGFKALGDLDCLFDIPGPDRTGQTIGAVVGAFDDLIHIAETQ